MPILYMVLLLVTLTVVRISPFGDRDFVLSLYRHGQVDIC